MLVYVRATRLLLFHQLPGEGLLHNVIDSGHNSVKKLYDGREGLLLLGLRLRELGLLTGPHLGLTGPDHELLGEDLELGEEDVVVKFDQVTPLLTVQDGSGSGHPGWCRWASCGCAFGLFG